MGKKIIAGALAAEKETPLLAGYPHEELDNLAPLGTEKRAAQVGRIMAWCRAVEAEIGRR
jgi:hypothetical protein